MKHVFLLLFLLISALAFGQGKPEGLFINSKAPDFRAKDQNGYDVSLRDLRKKGTTVILFYQGNWNPACIKELQRFQDSMQLITAKGAQVIAITPEGAEGVAKTVEKSGVIFPIITDVDAKIAKSYAVAYEVDERTLSRQKNFGNDLLAINNQKGKALLPVPAAYIINGEGSVTFRYFENDFRKRVNVKEILANLKNF